MAAARGAFPYKEYAHITRDQGIGAFTSADWRDGLRAVIAHETAHAAQHFVTWIGRHAAIDDRAHRNAKGLRQEKCRNRSSPVPPTRVIGVPSA